MQQDHCFIIYNATITLLRKEQGKLYVGHAKDLTTLDSALQGQAGGTQSTRNLNIDHRIQLITTRVKHILNRQLKTEEETKPKEIRVISAQGVGIEQEYCPG